MANTYIQTYGCSANQNNSEIMAGILNQSGHELTDLDNAEVIILNTCAVKKKTESKIKRKIQDLKNQFPNKKIIVTGCLAQTDAKAIQKINPDAVIFGTDHITEIASHVQSNLVQINLSKKREEKILTPKISSNKLIAIAQISEGCLSNCSFCKTKLAKGNLFSYPQEKIISSIKQDLESGAGEIWLTSQGNENYGMDSGQNQLIPLLNKILELPFNFKLRLGMMNPINLPNIEELIDIYKHPKMYKFLHIPIQSASNKILNDMKRGYTIEKVEIILSKFKKEIPNLAFATDIITGYPTETEEDHQKTVELIKKYKPDILNLSKFSKHKGTSADKLKDLQKKILNQRNQEIMRVHRKTALENKNKYLNNTITVFVNKKNNNGCESRDENYNIILINTKENILGKSLQVKITTIGPHHMIGETKKNLEIIELI